LANRNALQADIDTTRTRFLEQLRNDAHVDIDALGDDSIDALVRKQFGGNAQDSEYLRGMVARQRAAERVGGVQNLANDVSPPPGSSSNIASIAVSDATDATAKKARGLRSSLRNDLSISLADPPTIPRSVSIPGQTAPLKLDHVADEFADAIASARSRMNTFERSLPNLEIGRENVQAVINQAKEIQRVHATNAWIRAVDKSANEAQQAGLSRAAFLSEHVGIAEGVFKQQKATFELAEQVASHPYPEGVWVYIPDWARTSNLASDGANPVRARAKSLVEANSDVLDP